MADDNTGDPSACVARTIYNRPCEIPVGPGDDVCEAHAIARAEYENWWEWDDQDAADDFRRQEVLEARNAMLGIGVPVDTDQPQVVRDSHGQYGVLSGSRGGIRYSVALDPQPDGTAIYECRCRGWMINRRCSHIDQVIDFIGPDALPQKLPEWAEERGRCSAFTARGTQCRNTAMDGVAYCYQHAPRVEALPEPERVAVSALTTDSQSEIDEKPQTVAKRTPWWRRWWMVIVWIILVIIVVNAIGQAL